MASVKNLRGGISNDEFCRVAKFGVRSLHWFTVPPLKILGQASARLDFVVIYGYSVLSPIAVTQLADWSAR